MNHNGFRGCLPLISHTFASVKAVESCSNPQNFLVSSQKISLQVVGQSSKSRDGSESPQFPIDFPSSISQTFPSMFPYLSIHFSWISHGLPIDFPYFPKQLTVGVLNSILRCVRLVSGAVSASLGSVSPIICLPSFVSHVLCQGLCPPPWALCLPSVPKQFTVGVLNSLSSGVRLCSDGGVWLSGCPEFICPLVAIQLSPNLAGGVQLSGCLQFICLPLYQLICFPVWLVVSGSSAVSNSFVCPYINSFVSQSGWWCPALRLSQSRWWCPALWLSLIHLSPSLAGGVCVFPTIHLFPNLAGGVQLFGWLQFICPPSWHFTCLPVWLVVSGSLAVSNSFVSGLWQFICLPVWLVVSGFLCCLLSPIHLSSLVAIHLSPNLAGGVRLWLSPIDLSPLVATHLFPSLAGGVRLFGCLQFICLPIYRLVCLPVWLVVSGFGCLQFMCLPLWQSTCLPVWLGVFGSLRVSIPVWLVVSGLGYVQVICFPLVAIHLSPSLAGGVRLSACLDPTRLVVSGSSTVSNSFVFPCGNWFVSQSGWWCPALWLSPSHLFPLVAIHLFLSVALSLLILVVFHLSRRGEFPIVFRLPSRILICLPELVCPLPPSVFYLSPCFFPVVFQDVVSHLSPSGLAFVFQMWPSN